MFYRIFSPLLFRLDPETAHYLALFGIRAFVSGVPKPVDEVLGTSIAGIDFPNLVGLAAGFDKIDYLEVRDAETLAAPKPGRPLRVLAAARLGGHRLTDTIAV